MYGFNLNVKENICLVCKSEVGQGKKGIIGVVKKGHLQDPTSPPNYPVACPQATTSVEYESEFRPHS